MAINLLYTLLSSSKLDGSNKILTAGALHKIIMGNSVRYLTGTNNLGNFTLPRGLSSSFSLSSFTNPSGSIATTNYTNNSVRVATLQIGSSTNYPTSFSSYNVNTLPEVILGNQEHPITIVLSGTFNAKNIASLNNTKLQINFTGTPTDNFTNKVVQDKEISGGSHIYIEGLKVNTTNYHVITNAGIKNLADRFDEMNIHVHQAAIAYNNMTVKTHTNIIGGEYTVGSPTNKSRLYGATEKTANSNYTLSTTTLTLTNHAQKYGFSFTSTKLEHANSATSYLLKTTSGSFNTNTNSGNKGLIVWFSKNSISINGILGLIPDGSNITFIESGVENTNLTVRVSKEYLYKGKITQAYYNDNQSHLFIRNGNTYVAGVYDANELWYSLEQVFTITAPAFKELDA